MEFPHIKTIELKDVASFIHRIIRLPELLSPVSEHTFNHYDEDPLTSPTEPVTQMSMTSEQIVERVRQNLNRWDDQGNYTTGERWDVV